VRVQVPEKTDQTAETRFRLKCDSAIAEGGENLALVCVCLCADRVCLSVCRKHDWGQRLSRYHGDIEQVSISRGDHVVSIDRRDSVGAELRKASRFSDASRRLENVLRMEINACNVHEKRTRR